MPQDFLLSIILFILNYNKLNIHIMKATHYTKKSILNTKLWTEFYRFLTTEKIDKFESMFESGYLDNTDKTDMEGYEKVISKRNNLFAISMIDIHLN